MEAKKTSSKQVVAILLLVIGLIAGVFGILGLVGRVDNGSVNVIAVQDIQLTVLEHHAHGGRIRHDGNFHMLHAG